MTLREIDFLNKFWTLPGGLTLIQELLLAMIHRRILSTNRIKVARPDITRDQLHYCNTAVHSLAQLGYSFRSFTFDLNTESQLLKRLTEMIADYKVIVRTYHRKLRLLFTHEPADDESSKTLLMKLTNDPEVIPYYKQMAVSLITLYVCYLECMIVIIATYPHNGEPIALNSQVIYNLIVELRSISESIERMPIFPGELRSQEQRNGHPLYLYTRKFHYLIETFHYNQHLLSPQPVDHQHILNQIVPLSRPSPQSQPSSPEPMEYK